MSKTIGKYKRASKGKKENHLTFVASLGNRSDSLLFTSIKLDNLDIVEKPFPVEDAPSAVFARYDEKTTVIKCSLFEF